MMKTKSKKKLTQLVLLGMAGSTFAFAGGTGIAEAGDYYYEEAISGDWPTDVFSACVVSHPDSSDTVVRRKWDDSEPYPFYMTDTVTGVVNIEGEDKMSRNLVCGVKSTFKDNNEALAYMPIISGTVNVNNPNASIAQVVAACDVLSLHYDMAKASVVNLYQGTVWMSIIAKDLNYYGGNIDGISAPGKASDYSAALAVYDNLNVMTKTEKGSGSDTFQLGTPDTLVYQKHARKGNGYSGLYRQGYDAGFNYIANLCAQGYKVNLYSGLIYESVTADTLTVDGAWLVAYNDSAGGFKLNANKLVLNDGSIGMAIVFRNGVYYSKNQDKIKANSMTMTGGTIGQLAGSLTHLVNQQYVPVSFGDCKANVEITGDIDISDTAGAAVKTIKCSYGYNNEYEWNRREYVRNNTLIYADVTSATGDITVNGGTIYGSLKTESNAGGKGNITINGGTIGSTAKKTDLTAAGNINVAETGLTRYVVTTEEETAIPDYDIDTSDKNKDRIYNTVSTEKIATNIYGDLTSENGDINISGGTVTGALSAANGSLNLTGGTMNTTLVTAKNLKVADGQTLNLTAVEGTDASDKTVYTKTATVSDTADLTGATLNFVARDSSGADNFDFDKATGQTVMTADNGITVDNGTTFTINGAVSKDKGLNAGADYVELNSVQLQLNDAKTAVAFTEQNILTGKYTASDGTTTLSTAGTAATTDDGVLRLTADNASASAVTDANIIAGAYSVEQEATVTGGQTEITGGSFDKTIYAGYSAAGGVVTGNTVKAVGTSGQPVNVSTISAGYSSGGTDLVTDNIISLTYANVGTVDLVNGTNKLYVNDGVDHTKINLKNGSSENIYLNKTSPTENIDAGDYSVALEQGLDEGYKATGQNVDVNGGTVAGTIEAKKDAEINNASVSGNGSVTAGGELTMTNGTAKDNAQMTAKEVNVNSGTLSGSTSGTGVQITSSDTEATQAVVSAPVSELLNTILGGTTINISDSNIQGKVTATGVAGISGSTTVDSGSTFKADGALLVTGGTINGTLEATKAMAMTDGTVSSGAELKLTADNGALAIGGGTIEGTTTVSGNGSQIEISGGTLSGETTISGIGSSVTISGDTTVSGTTKVSGANSKVSVSGGNITGDIVGNGSEENGTTVSVSGGTLDGSGKSEGIKVTANEIDLDGAAQLINATLAAHIISLNSTLNSTTTTLALTGSQLDVKSLNNTALTIDASQAVNGAELNFYIPANAVSGDTMLTLSKATDISNSTVTVGVQKGSKLAIGDYVTLLTTGSNTLTADNLTYKENDKLSDSILTTNNLSKNFYTSTTKSGNSLVTTITKVGPGENAKSYVETQVANLAMLNAGNDLLAGMGLEQAAYAASQEAAGEQAEEAVTGGAQPKSVNIASRTMIPFAAMGGSSLRSHSGSYVDSHGFGIDVGFAKTIKNGSGELLFGPVFEYGKGSYASHLDNGTRGDGDSHYWGVGVFAKEKFHSGLYLEGSLRAGRITSDYRSADMGSYDSEAPFFAAHLGIGQESKIGKRDTLDVYGKYFYTHQNSDTVAIHDGGNTDMYEFDSVDSRRLRIGMRWSHSFNKTNTVYLGAAWQYEFGGTACASYGGEYAPSPSVKGGSGMYELGWKFTGKNDTTLDLTATGWSGKQEGITFGARVKFGF